MAGRRLLALGMIALGFAELVSTACGDSGGNAASVCVKLAPEDPAARDALLAALPKDDAGLPILTTTSAGLPDGVSISLVYDKAIDDPISRWGDCMELVSACRLACDSVKSCVEAIPSCGSNAGGKGCCPAACGQAFHARLAAGDTPNAAITNSYALGDCVDGFAAQVQAGQVSP
jgi:hypothetical protein